MTLVKKEEYSESRLCLPSTASARTRMRSRQLHLGSCLRYASHTREQARVCLHTARACCTRECAAMRATPQAFAERQGRRPLPPPSCGGGQRPTKGQPPPSRGGGQRPTKGQPWELSSPPCWTWPPPPSTRWSTTGNGALSSMAGDPLGAGRKRAGGKGAANTRGL